MKKVLLIVIAIVFLYFGSGILAAFLLERQAENYMQLALADISKPWSANKLSERASLWMLKKTILTPQKIADLSDQEFGGFIEFNRKPNCILQQGHELHSVIKHTWAICVNDAKFEKKSAVLKIRLIQENNEWKINDFISAN